MFQDNLKYLFSEIKKPFNGETIVLSHNQPTSYGLYFDGIQINSNSASVNNALGKLNNIETFLSKKTSLDIFLKNGSIQHLIHGNTNRFMG